MDIVFFNDWPSIGEIAVRTFIMYGYTVLLLRVAGKRTTMTLAGFDFIASVAMGTLVASTILSLTRPLLEGIVVLTLIVTLQWLVSFVVSRVPMVESLVVSPSRMLLENGQLYEDRLRSERLSREQFEQRVRNHGYASARSLAAVVLEPNGSVSVIGSTSGSEELIEQSEIGSRALTSDEGSNQ